MSVSIFDKATGEHVRDINGVLSFMNFDDNGEMFCCVVSFNPLKDCRQYDYVSMSRNTIVIG